MASDKAQLNRHVHFKKTLEDVGDVVVDVERGLVEDTGKYPNKTMAFIKMWKTALMYVERTFP